MTCHFLTTCLLTHSFVKHNVTKKSFLRGALSAAGAPSSKRVLAAFAVFIAVLIIPASMIFANINVPYSNYFDSLLIFASACLTGTVIESFQKNNPVP